MSLSIEASIRKLLDEDKVCMGRVSAATVRTLALQFAREPELDGDVLAERVACVAQFRNCQARLTALAADDGGEAISTEARRVAEAIHSIELGLHRIGRPPAAEGADRTNVWAVPSIPPVGGNQSKLADQGNENGQG